MALPTEDRGVQHIYMANMVGINARTKYKKRAHSQTNIIRSIYRSDVEYTEVYVRATEFPKGREMNAHVHTVCTSLGTRLVTRMSTSPPPSTF